MPGAVLSWLGRHAPLILAAGIFIGLVAQELAQLLRPAVPAAVAALMILAYLRVRFGDLRTELLQPRLLLISAGMLLISPIVVWWLCLLLGVPAVLSTAMVLGAALPTLFSSPSMALLLGLDGALALATLLITMMLTPFTLALVAAVLLDFDLAISPLNLMLRLAVFLGGCMLVGMLIRRWIGTERVRRNNSQLDGISVLVLLIFAISIMDGIPAVFLENPQRIVYFVIAAFAMNMGLQLFSGALCLGLGRRRALTLGFISGNRSLGLLLAVLPASADPGLALFFILGQFPIYILPAALAPLYRKAV